MQIISVWLGIIFYSCSYSLAFIFETDVLTALQQPFSMTVQNDKNATAYVHIPKGGIKEIKGGNQMAWDSTTIFRRWLYPLLKTGGGGYSYQEAEKRDERRRNNARGMKEEETMSKRDERRNNEQEGWKKKQWEREMKEEQWTKEETVNCTWFLPSLMFPLMFPLTPPFSSLWFPPFGMCT